MLNRRDLHRVEHGFGWGVVPDDGAGGEYKSAHSLFEPPGGKDFWRATLLPPSCCCGSPNGVIVPGRDSLLVYEAVVDILVDILWTRGCCFFLAS